MVDESAEFNRVSISIKDMEEASAYLVAYSDDQEEVIRRALLTAAIVAYARPFKRSNAGASGQSTRKLSDFVETRMDERQRALHDKVIALRDQGVAHSDYDKKPTRRVPSAPRSVARWSKPFDVLSEFIDIAIFREVTRQIENQCISRLFVLTREGRPHGHSELPASVSVQGGVMTVNDGELKLQVKLQDLTDKRH